MYNLGIIPLIASLLKTCNHVIAFFAFFHFLWEITLDNDFWLFVLRARRQRQGVGRDDRDGLVREKSGDEEAAALEHRVGRHLAVHAPHEQRREDHVERQVQPQPARDKERDEKRERAAGEMGGWSGGRRT